MNIFVIDTSTDTGTVGISSDGEILSEERFEIKKGAALTAHSYIRKVFEHSKISVEELDLIGTAIGPGSFTGLRVALSAAKGLAHPFATPMVGIDSTHAIAERIKDNGLIVPIIDARRDQFYRAIYERKGSVLKVISGVHVIDKVTVLDGIPDGAVVTGPGADRIEPRLLRDFEIPEKSLRYSSVEDLARIAIDHFRNGDILNIETSTPRYIREPDVKPQ
jgi:tRNA threonylcarbamoyladenosine biosynthesis protein TsaB